jgi:ankyrin repeat protein
LTKTATATCCQFFIIFFPGNFEIVELLLSRGINVDLHSVQGTPLHAAALHKQDCMMKFLLEHHADVRHHFLDSLLGCVQKKNSEIENLVFSCTCAPSLYSI